MSQENVGVVVKQFERTNARDFAGVMETWAADVTLILHGEVSAFSSDTTTRKAAVGEWFGDWFRQFGPDYRFDIEESRDFGDRVFVVATHHARGRRSGATVEQRIAYVYTVREGKVSRVEVWAGPEARVAALEAAGLRE
jgi:ketosteroid isomerase-like protein